MNRPDTIRRNLHKFILDYHVADSHENDGLGSVYFVCDICKHNNYWRGKDGPSHRYNLSTDGSWSIVELCEECNKKFLAKKDDYPIERERRLYRKNLIAFRKRLEIFK